MTTAPPAADDAIRARLDDRYGRRRGGPSRWVIVLGLAGKADDEAGADRDLGTDFAPALEAFKYLGLVRRALHGAQHAHGRGQEGLARQAR